MNHLLLLSQELTDSIIELFDFKSSQQLAQTCNQGKSLTQKRLQWSNELRKYRFSIMAAEEWMFQLVKKHSRKTTKRRDLIFNVIVDGIDDRRLDIFDFGRRLCRNVNVNWGQFIKS